MHPSPSSQRFTGAIAFTAVAMLLAGVAWLRYGNNELSDLVNAWPLPSTPSERPTPAQRLQRGSALTTVEESTAKTSAVEHSSAARLLRSSRAAPKSTAETPGAAGDVDLSPTSWENPFAAEYWRSEGWKFAATSMSCDTSEQPAIARFRRPYRKLLLQFRLQPLQSRVAMQVRLVPADDSRRSATIITVNEAGVTVVTEQGDRVTPIGQKPIDLETTDDQAGQLRLAATGNRIVIAWNDQHILSCDQPSGPGGIPLRFEIVSSSALHIGALRVEGE